MIRVLSRDVADRIAAGEVVERPASVVKELVENALDAGARSVTVEIAGGGRTLIRVADDGSGMTPEDLALCLLPHATSKIAAAEDIFHVATFGFRGEALAAVGSVSETRVVSRPEDRSLGASVEAAFGDIGPVRDAGAPRGTTVEVHHLFRNTPARLKFLKSDTAEAQAVMEALLRLALPRPDVSFRLRRDGRDVLEVEGGVDSRQRLRDLFGADMADEALEAASERSDIRVSGFVLPPGGARPSARWQYLFLNGRYIRDRGLVQAVHRAFQGLLIHGRHPVFFLGIEMDPGRVDVNVHPTKIEVRFRERDLVFSAVCDAVRRALDAGGGVRRLETAGFLAEAPESPMLPVPAAAPVPAADGPDLFRSEDLRELESRLYPRGVPQAPRSAGAAPAPRSAGGALPQVHAPPVPRPASGGRRHLQVHGSWILVEDAKGVLVVDQHALHERMLFERLLERVTAGAVESQTLLAPVVVDLPAPDFALAGEAAEALAAAGLVVAPFGPRSVAVRALPALLARMDPAEALLAALEPLREDGGAPPLLDRVREVCAHLACRAAVKFHERLHAAEIDVLLDFLGSHPRAGTCPHGRPTRVAIPLGELARAFERR